MTLVQLQLRKCDLLHSTRMRTAHLLTVSGGGGYAFGGRGSVFGGKGGPPLEGRRGVLPVHGIVGRQNSL